MGCGAVYTRPCLHCDRCEGLLRSRYEATGFEPVDRPGMFAFSDWLPCEGVVDAPVGTVVFPSRALGERLGLHHLSIAYSGYAPSVGALNPTGTFKDLEAYPTLLLFREQGARALILASAGNTARAFAYAAGQMELPVVLVVPERARDDLWLPCPPNDAARVILLEGCDDYALTIRAAAFIGRTLDLANEGGARNVARRDGIGTAVLEFARRTGAVPDHYVQAVGSGTGGIAAWEASERLIAAGLTGRLPRLHLSQNAPFAPLHEAWAFHTPIEPDLNVEEQMARIARVDAPVLANRTPPYELPGGVRDALTATKGWTYAISNREARAAATLFEETERLSVGTAAAVAAAALVQAAKAHRLGTDDEVLLHITGNENGSVWPGVTRHPLPPVWTVRPEALGERSIRKHMPAVG
jgi:cysteate synthase